MDDNLQWVLSCKNQLRVRKCMRAESPHLHILLCQHRSKKLGLMMLPKLERTETHKWCVCEAKSSCISLIFFSAPMQYRGLEEVELSWKKCEILLVMKTLYMFPQVSLDSFSLPSISSKYIIFNSIDRFL